MSQTKNSLNSNQESVAKHPLNLYSDKKSVKQTQLSFDSFMKNHETTGDSTHISIIEM